MVRGLKYNLCTGYSFQDIEFAVCYKLLQTVELQPFVKLRIDRFNGKGLRFSKSDSLGTKRGIFVPLMKKVKLGLLLKNILMCVVAG